MRYTWDLKVLYLKKEDFYYDMTLVRDKIKKINEYREIKINGYSLYDLMSKCFEIRKINSKTLLYASLNYYLDINNDSFIKMKAQAEELDCFVANETGFIDELIKMIDINKLDSFYFECKDLKKYKFYIDNVRRMSINNDRSKIDIINEKRMEVNSNQIKYNRLISEMSFGNVQKESLNISNIGKYLIDDDRLVRKDTFDCLNISYKNKQKDYFLILKKNIELKKEISGLFNYSSVLESELFKDDIDKVFIENLINSVNKNIFIMNNYLKLKCKYLKIVDPKLYDINVSLAKNNYEYKIDDALNIFKDLFSIFGSDYIDAMNYLIDNNCLDLDCNENKHPSIVFSWNIYSFMNYNGKYIDLNNLCHELGHTINFYFSSKKQLYIYEDSSVFIGEIAALINEVLLNEYLYEKADTKEQKIFYLTKLIENFISQVFRQTMYTEFENIVYSKDVLNLDFVNSSYLGLVKKYYGKVIDIDDNIACEWMRVGYLFRWSYYVYKYAANYIISFNVIKKIKEDGFEKYIDFLSSGSSCSNYDLLKKLDIDLYDINLINNSFDILNNYIEELDQLLNN